MAEDGEKGEVAAAPQPPPPPPPQPQQQPQQQQQQQPPPPPPPQAKEVEVKAKEPKSTMSLLKKKAPSKAFQSKMSLKQISSLLSYTSDTSLVNKKQSDFERIAKAPRFQNTYRLDSKYPFKADEVQKLLMGVVEKEVVEFPQYDGNIMPKLAQLISNEVRNGVKHLNYDRYKLCVMVIIGEKKLHGFQASFRALWDADRDSWATYFYQCRTYFVSCTCFGLYHD